MFAKAIERFSLAAVQDDLQPLQLELIVIPQAKQTSTPNRRSGQSPICHDQPACEFL
jgi:hypothetical protein